ncbi:putative alpha/beta superfamily hydrolase [Vibrio crassostreae]|nr:putative alpha/beta superfamily hydrolase [Vibrio crassostreae]CAK2333600.1 putative alpha/beta superfamily hydrolase [Vibrio crassostreae]CAK2501968.1 putative alpha/beta superfamily hydrolase [Vibrio crassostreae]CAK2809755.1 putative alpha/beta superfamily hydrolase [Vibrio crassostreae]
MQSELIIIDEFFIPQLNRTRTIRIYLPIGYHQSEQAYPVLYMHDGQNVFEESTATYGMCWDAQTTLDEMQRLGKLSGLIVVAIDSSDELDKMGRYNEYSPWKANANIKEMGVDDELLKFGGEGDEYMAFISQTLKPYLDQKYRTKPSREFTYLAGSSMGGLISLYGGCLYQNTFGAIGVFSPAFWFNKPSYFQYIKDADFSYPIKIYMDMGTDEARDNTKVDFAGVYLTGSREVNELLTQKKNVTLFYQECDGHKHNELAWSLRFPDFIDFIFRK